MYTIKSLVSQSLAFTMNDGRIVIINGASKNKIQEHTYAETRMSKADWEEIYAKNKNVYMFKNKLIICFEAPIIVSEEEKTEIKEKMKKDKQIPKEEFGKEEK